MESTDDFIPLRYSTKFSTKITLSSPLSRPPSPGFSLWVIGTISYAGENLGVRLGPSLISHSGWVTKFLTFLFLRSSLTPFFSPCLLPPKLLLNFSSFQFILYCGTGEICKPWKVIYVALFIYVWLIQDKG